MSAVVAAVGVVLILVSVLDLGWTTVAAGSGAGPVTSRMASGIWQVALGLHRRRESHQLLSVAGVITVFAVLGAWIVLAVIGWLLVFASSDGAVRASDTGAPASFVERIYFVGYTVFTLGNGDYAPGLGVWQLATVLATGTGLVLVTLAITYLVPVASAVAQRRQLASYIASLGTAPDDILIRSWTGSGFGLLAQHFVALTPLVHGARQRHFTYPVLHYFHSRDRESAAAPNIANLAEALHLLGHGVASDVRPDRGATTALDNAIGSFLDTLTHAYIAPADRPLPPPTLDGLRRVGIPTVDDDHYGAAAATATHRRSLLAGMLDDDGWTRKERRQRDDDRPDEQCGRARRRRTRG
ncbi:MAG TPA: potassium channel family protein [Acidimicrobiales bacterium]|nr:potassium channel family protein [Acidimicrobiales bacterium]